MRRYRGFTLVELLVVITIIGVLSTVGLTLYSGVQNKAQDAKKRQDIDAIATAYELKYNGAIRQYQVLNEGDFNSGQIPKQSDGGNYSCLVKNSAPSFKVCTVLSDKTVYCRSSTRGTPPQCVTGAEQ